MKKGHQRTDVIEIDMGEIIRVLLHNAFLIGLVGILAAFITVMGTKVLVVPEYQSTTKMIILTKQDVSTITNADLQASSSLTKDYIELVKSRTVIEGVITDLSLDMSYEGLLSKLQIDTPEETRIIEISVSDESPNRAAQIADTVRQSASEHIQQVMNTEAVNVVDKANIPASPYKPNIKKNAVLGGAAGAFLCIVFICAIFLADDTIKNTEDVEKYLNLSVLGNIPSENKRSKKNKKTKWKHSKNKHMKRQAV